MLARAAMPPTPPIEPALLRGIGFMLVAASLLPVMNGLVAWLSPRYPTEQLVWARIAGQFAVMLALMLPGAGLRVLATRAPLAQLGRSFCQFASTSLYFVAIASLPLAKAAAIAFSGPFMVALLAWPVLGEKPLPWRLLIIGCGFVGVLLVIRPGAAAFQPESLLLVASAFSLAIYQLLTRKVAGRDPPATSTLWSALLGSVVLSLWMPFVWVAPGTVADVLALLALGLLAAAGHYCIAIALANGPAAVISPFQYWQIVGATLMGVLLTGLWPDAFTWAGAAVVVAAGVAMAWTEGRRAR